PGQARAPRTPADPEPLLKKLQYFTSAKKCGSILTLMRMRSCRIGKLHKHGFYKRFYLDGLSFWRILIRRYCCTRCGTTISFLPSFCVPKFQYSLCLLWE